MKFRFSVQPKPKEFKSIVPSHLLSDPAFSADPRLNPYSVTNQEFAWDAPPLGHPVLKNKNRGPLLANFASHNGITASADFDFQLLQPPNSPVSYIGGSGTQHQDPSFPFPPLTLNTTSSANNPPFQSVALPPTAFPLLHPRSESPSSPTAHPQPPAAKEGKKKKRMNFLSRRKTIQATASNPAVASAGSISKTELLSGNNVSRTVASRTVSASILSVPRDRPILPPRATTSGTGTPRSTVTANSATSKRPVDNRTNDLDRIDELDETNPLGLSLHHDGPYEAAAQALKRGGNVTPLGSGENGRVGYMQGMQAYGRPYCPPQAPIGISLNLSPGQILPRNFGEQRINAPPQRIRDTSTLPPRMQQAYPPLHPSLSRSQSQVVSSQVSSTPPRHLNRLDTRPDDLQSDPSRNRRQSQPPPSALAPLPNPHPVIRPKARLNPGPDFPHSYNQSQVSLESSFLPPNPQTSQFNPETNSLHQSLDSRNDSNSDSSISRRHSQNLHRPLVVSDPGSESSHLATSSSQFRDIEPTLNLNKADETHAEDTPFDIGMAMLHLREESDTPIIPTPRVFLPHGTPDPEEEFNPYDPIHLENEHSRTPSPLAPMYDSSSHSSHASSGRRPSRELSRQPSPVRSLEVPNVLPARPIRNSERRIKQNETPPTTERNAIDPPPYSLVVAGTTNVVNVGFDDRKEPSRRSSRFSMAATTQAASPSITPEQTSSRKSDHSGPSEESHNSKPDGLEFVQPVIFHGVHLAVQTQDMTPDRQQQVRNSDAIAMYDPPVQNVQSVANQEQRKPPPDLQQVMPMLPARRSRERLVPSTVSSHELERDGRSTHQSISTASSGHPRSGPPPPRRHIPKHLVMPTPLNTNNNGNNANPNGSPLPHRMHSSPPPTYVLPRQIPPRRAQATFQPHAQIHYPPPSSSPLASNIYAPSGTKESQEIHITASRKLKKRTSVMSPPSAVQIAPLPMISTVSFAPPVVGYDHPVSKSISRLKTEKTPKRVLSKRKTDL